MQIFTLSTSPRMGAILERVLELLGGCCGAPQSVTVHQAGRALDLRGSWHCYEGRRALQCYCSSASAPTKLESQCLYPEYTYFKMREDKVTAEL